MMLLAGMFVFTSCDDDRDSNPTLIQPTSFVLNQPEIGAATVDLQKSTGINLTWSQPEYTTFNAPVVATYEIQLSTTGSFNQRYDDTLEDNTGADYICLDQTPTECRYTVSTSDIDKALMQLNLWDETAVPQQVELSLRLRASVKDAGLVDHNPIVSNVVKINAVPYYIELSDAPVVMWYLVGNLFGGKWGSNIGVDALPMFIIPGYEYDKKTGVGEITYCNYFETGEYSDTKNECDAVGFKIQPSDFNWDKGITGDNVDKAGAACTKGTLIFRNGGDGGHIVAPENGYFKITINTKDMKASMVKMDVNPKAFASVCLSGGFNEWGDTPMSAYNKDGIENHVWYYMFETADATELKFKEAGSWDSNWGGKDFPVGIGVGNGDNISVGPGKWLILFNDITGEYNFINMQQ